MEQLPSTQDALLHATPEASGMSEWNMVHHAKRQVGTALIFAVVTVTLPIITQFVVFYVPLL